MTLHIFDIDIDVAIVKEEENGVAFENSAIAG